jgi:hypothetical protein
MLTVGVREEGTALTRRKEIDMTTRDERKRSDRNEAGIALIAAMLLTVMALILVSAVATLMMTGTNGTRLTRSGEVARGLAEAGINATVFQIEAATNPSTGPVSIETYLANMLGAATNGNARAGTKTFTGTLSTGTANGTYTVTLSDPSAGDGVFTLTSVGTEVTNRKRTLVAIVKAEPPAALNYAMFGNKIEFHNHNNIPNALTLNTTMFSNGTIQIARGISISGLAQAVNSIQPNQGGDNSLPNTVLTPAGQQGDPNPMTSDPVGQVVQIVPGPPIQAFPTFDFATAQSTASAAGRQVTPTQLTTLISNAQTCANAEASDGTGRQPGYGGAPAACSTATVYSGTGVSAATVPLQIIHYKTSVANPDPRSIAVPNATNPSAAVPLGSADGTSNPATNTNLYEIQVLGNPLADTVLYVSGSLTLEQPTTTLLQFQGSLIVNGAITIHTPSEFLAWDNRTGSTFVPLGQSLYTDASGNPTVATTLSQAAAGQPYDIIYSNWPAIAANGAMHVDDSPNGDGGPVHIEGPVYSVAESHFHKSNANESSYAVGAEIADTIHNCQWFSFAYDPRAKSTLGLSDKAAGRAKLQVIRIEDHN